MRTRTELVWECLAGIPDPEIPVISVVDLGIIRGVHWNDRDECVVTVTPTYSGCPATAVIAESIAEGLRTRGISEFKLETSLSPAWSTDWISDDGRRKLKDYGIAPPGSCASSRAIDISGLRSWRRPLQEVRCPHCGTMSTRLVSEYGSTLCKALYRCRDCLEAFDYFKPI